MYYINDAQFLNITPLFILSAHFAASAAPAPLLVIVPLTSMYASLLSHNFDIIIEVLNLI